MEPSKKRGRPKKVVVITEQNFPSIVESIKKQVETAQEFVITVTIEQQTYTGRGATALDALKAVPTPPMISTGLLVITHGDKRKEMLYPTMQLKRIFNIHHQDVLIHDIVLGL